jgi:hypothetical protein
MATTKLLTTQNLPLTGHHDWHAEVAKGSIEGHESVNVFGLNEVVSTTIEDIWTPGGSRVWLTAPVTLEAISASADDDADAGSGAMAIVVVGLDSDFNPIQEVIAMNGLSASNATQQSFLRVNTLAVVASGTYAGANVGTITVRTSSGGATQAEIANGTSGAGTSQQSHYTVPAGHSAILYNIFVNVDSGFAARVSLAFNQGAEVVSGPPFASPVTQFEIIGVQGQGSIQLGAPALIEEKTDIWLKASVAVTDAAVSGGYGFTLVNNDYLCDQGIYFS